MPTRMFWFWPGAILCGDNSTELKINEACLEIASLSPSPLQLLLQSTQCRGCALSRRGTIQPNTTEQFVIESSHRLRLVVEGSQNCSETKWFDDFGLYTWEIHDSLPCRAISVKEAPEHFWLNVGAVILVCVIIAVLFKLVSCIRKSNWYTRLATRNVPFQELVNDGSEPTLQRRSDAGTGTRRLSRVTSIDILRGIAITLMVFVNYGGGQYSSFKHAPWDGLTVADVVFPFFIWIMGVSTVISLRSQLRATIKRKDIFLKVLRRSAVLVSLGIILNSGKGGGVPLRIPGVLQRIGLTYFIVATIELIFAKPQRSEQYGPWNRCVEIVDAPFQWLVISLFAAAHLAITFYLPVPGCPTGYIGPGGLAENSQFFNCTGGAAGYIDRLVFTDQHIYQRPTSQKIYHSTVPYDPEGLLGLLTSVVMAFLGVHCGRIILSYERTQSRIVRWLLCGLITGIGAGMLSGWGKEYAFIPVNKNLWSASYVLATSSMAFILFTIIYCLVDVRQWWSGGPFVYAGMNSIAIYLGHEIMNKQLPWRWTPFTTTHFELLAMDVSATAIWLFISYAMYAKNVFISL